MPRSFAVIVSDCNYSEEQTFEIRTKHLGSEGGCFFLLFIISFLQRPEGWDAYVRTTCKSSWYVVYVRYVSWQVQLWKMIEMVAA